MEIITKSENEKLMACPFCGKDVACLTNAKELEDCQYFEDDRCECYKELDEENRGFCFMWTVVCDYSKGGCGTICGYHYGKEKAIARWNTRGVVLRKNLKGEKL